MGEAVAEHHRRLLQHRLEGPAGVGLEERAERRAADDQQLERLDDGRDLAAGEHVAAEDAPQDHDDADDFCHRNRTARVEGGGTRPGYRPAWAGL
ncbi:hypothetical protein D9M73_263930 [compost metagenome]